jgi:putative DNA primase/helicase
VTPEEVVHLYDAHPAGEGWSARCPGSRHGRGDQSPSLSIGLGEDGRVLFHCHVGCSTEEVLAARGLTVADLFPVSFNGNGSGRHLVASYEYHDASGEVVYTVHRYHPKDFRQQAPDGTWKTAHIPKVLYHLPEVLVAVTDGQAIAICEGEKDAEVVNRVGTTFGVATCNPGGAGKWRPEYAEVLQGAARVAVLVDNDDPGRLHAAQVAISLLGRVLDLRVFLPASGKDVSEHLRAGLALSDLVRVDDETWRAWLLPGGASETGSKRLYVIQGHTVTTRAVEWLWPAWLPRGKLLVLDGDPDGGKSTLMTDVAARLTRGTPMPDGQLGAVGDVLFLSAEDDPEDTTVPRLMAHEADLARIHLVQAVVDDKGEAPVSIPRDLALIETVIRDTGTVLVVVDVLAEYLDAGVDSHKDTDVRRALHLIRGVAQRTGAAFVLMRHLNKTVGAKALYRGGGSIGVIGAARGGWVVAYHPAKEQLRVLATTKMNAALKPTPLGFVLQPAVGLGCARLEWQGTVDIGADALVNPPTAMGRQEAEEKESKAEFCARIMRDLLTLNDQMWTDDLYEALVVENRVGKNTYDTVRARLTYVIPDKKPDGTRGYRVRLK